VKSTKRKSRSETKRKELGAPKGVPGSFMLYRLNRCHPKKVNKIKGFATFEAILCASLIDA
jgi:hypothetical protein